MASREATAIRQETARNRIIVAAETLAFQLNQELPDVSRLNPKGRDQNVRAAMILESAAEILESLIIISVEPGQALDKEGMDGVNHASAGGSDSAQQTEKPIKRSETSRKRR